MDLSDFRQEYTKLGLSEDQLDKDPICQFRKWLEQACQADLLEPNCMALSTVSSQMKVSIRNVLLKAFDEKGFVFYTNYTSSKSNDIEQNPNVGLLFSWLGLQRQVEITGRAEKVSSAESLKYFISRPFGSKLGAWVSHQSKVISTRALLEKKLDEVKRKFQDGKVPLPDFWGGYRVVPEKIEFWQGRQNRLHDRFEYFKDENSSWTVQRLAP